MNKTGVLAALAATALLGVAAWWVSRPAGTAAAPEPILGGVDPSLARSLTVRWGGSSATLTQSGESWMMERSVSPGLRWPVQPETVRAGIRLLCAAEGQAASGSTASPTGPAVEIGLEGGGRAAAHFAAEALAGRCLVRVAHGPGPERDSLVAESLARLFEERAVAEWRSRRALAVEAPASRVSIAGPGGRVSLSRAGGAWGLVEPALGRADEPAVAEMLSKLGGIEVERFEDQAPASELGLGDQSPVVVVESDRRALEGDQVARRIVRQQIRIGGRADVAGRSVFIELSGREVDAESGAERSSWGPIVASVEAARLEALTADAVAYVDRRACDTPAADVTRLSFRGAEGEPGTVIERTVDGWSWTTGAQPLGPMPLEDVRPLQGLLKLVCETRAARVARATEDPRPGVGVELQRRDGPPVSLVLRTGGGGVEGPEWISLTSAGLERRYPLDEWRVVSVWAGDRLRPAR